MSATTCEHGMPNPRTCIDCMNEGGLPPEPRPVVTVVGGPFEARYPGDCRGCHLGIHEGQRIVRMSDESYRHEGCP